MRRRWPMALIAAAVAGCAGDGRPTPPPAPPAGRGAVLVATLGDSITAGSPLWDPDPRVRDALGEAADPRSQYQYWVQRRVGTGVRVRNCGIVGETTAEIADRLEVCARGARVLIVQGGLNDIAQGVAVAEAAENMRGMVRHGKSRGMRVALAEVTPWNNGYPEAAPAIERLNRLLADVARDERVTLLRWYRSLEDPQRPGRMRAGWTSDGDHPSIAGYRRLGEAVKLP